MKEKSPAFQFYYKEWITGTMSMNRVERDIYLLLIIASYDMNGLPSDSNEIYRIALCKSKKERESVDYILSKKFFKDSDGKFKNKRMENVRSNQLSFKQNKSVAGRKGAEKRWQSDGTAISLPLAKDSSTTTTTITTNHHHQQQAHEVFAKKIFTEECDYDRVQLELGLAEKRLITDADVAQFNAHLHTEGRNHVHFSEWKSHLRNWLNTRPTERVGQNQSKQTSPKNGKDLSSESTYENSKSVL